MRGHNKSRFLVLMMTLLALIISAVPAVAQEGGDFDLTILHTNDVHARVDQSDGGGNTCDEEEAAANECVGGAARAKTAADAVRSEVANSVLVDAGDQFLGTLFFKQYQGGAAQEMMNMLGYDAMTIGNHEFDAGPGTLGSFLRGISFPAVSANIDASAEPELAGLIQPYTVLDVNGNQVGVVGVTTVETGILSSPGPNVVFNDVAASVQAAVDELAGQGINKVIVLSHIGYPADQDLAGAVTGVDVIVGGHSHTLLSNTDEDASGPYPTVVDATDGNPVLIVTDGSYGRALGRLDVSFDADGVVTSYSGDPIALDSSVAQDETVQARVDELAAPVNALTEQVIGTAAVDLDGERTTCRFAECTMGNLITDAMLWKTQGEGVQLAITNGGGIRASIAAGDVTVGDVLTVLPFGNLISTFELTGQEVVDALENGVSRAENPDNEGTGRFPQVAGLRYVWDSASPVGSRIKTVEVMGQDGSYSQIDLTATYKVASNDYMRGGGDGYEVFVTAANAYDFGPSLDEALQDYIAQNSPIEAVLEQRIMPADGASAMAEGEEEMMAPAEGGTMAGDASCAEDYVVQADDWLSKIAEKVYGDVLAYQVIFDATNAAAAAGGAYDVIADPNVIEVGQTLCIPAAEASMDSGAEMMAAEAAPAEEAASTEETAMMDSGALQVAMLIPGKIDDGGFMEAGYNGLLSIEQALGAEISYIDQIQPEQELLAAALRELAQQNPDLIIAHGGQNSQATAQVAAEFPDIRFVVVQGNVTGDNLSSYEILQEQSAWLAGAAAGLLTQSGVVGHISGIQVTPGLKGRAAFAAGLNETNPEARFLTTFSGSQDDADLAKQVAMAQINEGADIIFTMLNAARTGAIEANKETGTFQMGNVRDWYEVEPDVFIASALANVSMAGLRAAEDVASGNWQPGTVVKIGLEDPDAVSLALAPSVSEEVRQQIDALAEKIKSGEIEVSTEYSGEEFSVEP